MRGGTVGHKAITDLRQALGDLFKMHEELIAHTSNCADEHVIKEHQRTLSKFEEEFGLD